MGILDRFRTTRRSAEKRASTVSAAKPNFLQILGLEDIGGTGETVTVEKALGVPAIWAAVNFLSGTLAGLPLRLYQKTDKGRAGVNNNLSTILQKAVNDEMSSFEWRKSLFDAVFTTGRHISFIERNGHGDVMNIWPLVQTKVTIKRIDGKKVYYYKDGKRTHKYDAAEVIDIVFMHRPDMLGHRSPILTNKESIALILAITKYGARFFRNGGVPPFAIEGPFETPAGMKRASDDLQRAVATAAKEGRLGLGLPLGHKIHAIGVDPEKSQMVETQRFLIEQVARIYSLPPTFLQDLTHGTFSNTEQQDLQFVKHTLKRWAEQFEQEVNLKLLGRENNGDLYVEFNMDGLLRGDFKTRMEGLSLGINSAIITPDEARHLDNRESKKGGDKLYIQGATVPIENTGSGGK